MEHIAIETLVRMVEQLSPEEREEFVRRIEPLLPLRQRPSQTLRVFHVDRFPEHMTLRRKDEYGDDER